MKTGTHEYKMASIGIEHLGDILSHDEIADLHQVFSAYLSDDQITAKMAATVDKVAGIATPGFENIKAFRDTAKVGDKRTITNNGLVFELECFSNRVTFNIVKK